MSESNPATKAAHAQARALAAALFRGPCHNAVNRVPDEPGVSSSRPAPSVKP